MPREDAATKARRLLADGRLTLLYVGRDAIRGGCKGDSGASYLVGWKDGAWFCTCEAIGRCSHIRAVQLCTVEPDEGRAA